MRGSLRLLSTHRPLRYAPGLAVLASTQGSADDLGGRCAWVAVFVAGKTIDLTRPTCRQAFGEPFGVSGERAKGS